MRTVDSIVDAFEERVAREGIESVDLGGFVTQFDAKSETPSDLDLEVLTELVRVWMEHRRSAALSFSAQEALSLFPQYSFSEEQRRILEFEESRLLSASPSDAPDTNLGEELPGVGENWLDFHLLELLGEGAFAKVYLASQHSMADRPVVLKLSRRHTPESQVLAKLHHSSIVPIYSAHSFQGINGVCMPYLGNTTVADLLGVIDPTTTKPMDSSRKKSVAGVDLLKILSSRQRQITTVSEPTGLVDTQDPRTFLQAGGDTSEGEAFDELSIERDQDGLLMRESTAQELSKLDYVDAVAWIGSQIANALAHAHRRGILHCDVKPANILVASDGQVRLLDFNVSLHEYRKAQGEQAIAGGTLPYMSPEQYGNLQDLSTHRIDHRSDIYSLGIVLLEMLIGRVPRQRPSSSNIPVKQLLKDLNPTVTPAFVAIIDRCVQNDPEQRYATADELYEDLDAHCHQLPLRHSKEPSLRERLLKWCRRHPVLTSSASVASMGVFLVAAMGAAYVWRGRTVAHLQSQQRRDQFSRQLPKLVAAATALRGHPDLQDEVLSQSLELFALLPESELPEVSENDRIVLAGLTSLLIHEKELGLLQGTTEAMHSLERHLTRLGEVNDSASEDLWQVQDEAGAPDVLELDRLRDAAYASDYATHLRLGSRYLDAREYGLAQEEFSQCIGLRPDIEYAWFYRGIARQQNQRYALAATDFQHVIDMHPQFLSAYYNRALALEALGKKQEAVEQLDQAFRAGWKSVLGYSMRSRLRAQLGDPTGATEDFERAVATQPRTTLEWVQRGLMKIATDPEAAESDLLEAIRRDPNQISAHQNLAHLYSERLKRPAKSLEHLDVLVRLDSKNPTQWAGRGVVLARQGKLQEALADLSQAGQLPVEDPLVAYQIASGFALLAGKLAPQAEQEAASEGEALVQDRFPQIFQAALQWYKLALRQQPSLVRLVSQDPDMDWMRKQDAFLQANAALAILSQDSSRSSLRNGHSVGEPK